MKKIFNTHVKIAYFVIYVISLIVIAAGILMFYFTDFRDNSFLSNMIVSIGICLFTGCLTANLISAAEKKDNKNSQIATVVNMTSLIVNSVLKLTYSVMAMTDKTFDRFSDEECFGYRFYKFCEDFSGIIRLLEKKQRKDCLGFINKSSKNLKIVLIEYGDSIKNSKYHPFILQTISQVDELLSKNSLVSKVSLLKEIIQKLEKIETISQIFDKPINYASGLMVAFRG